MGPTVIEGSVNTELFKRADMSKMIKTPAETWKQGKPPTTTHPGTLPGSHSELRATMRTPSYMRGLPSRAKTALGYASEGDAAPEGVGSVAVEQSHSSMGERARSASALGMLEHGPRARPALAGIGGMELQLMELKGDYARLKKITAEKLVDVERLRQAQARGKKDEGITGGADDDIEDFRARTWVRIDMQEGRLEEVMSHRAALEEVTRRLKLVNKGLDHRLVQTKEELRKYGTNVKEMQVGFGA